MPKTTPTNCPRAYTQSLPPVSCGRRSTWRLARSAVIVLGAGTLAGLAVFLFTSTRGKEAFAVPETCTPPLPEPGPARPWEAQVSVSTYSSVNTRNGNVFTAIPVVSWSGIGPDMNMMLYHNSAAVEDTSFAQAVGFNLGPGWSISYSDRLLLDQLPNITLVRADGTRDVFTWNSAQQTWSPPSGVHDVLTEVADLHDSIWRVTHKDQSYHQFRQLGGTGGFARLDKIVDAVGNGTGPIYSPGIGLPPVSRLQSVTAAGRAIQFQYDTLGGPLMRLYDPRDEAGAPGPGDITNRFWTLEYEPTTGRLSTFTGPRGKPIHLTYGPDGRIGTISERHEHSTNESTPPTWTYTYTDGRLTRVDDPAGVGGGLMQQFAVTCRAVGQGFIVFYFTKTTYTNRRGYTWTYTYPEGGNVGMPNNVGTLESVEDPVGTTQYGFDGGRNLLWYSDANYHVWQSTYDWAGNMLTLRDPLFHTQSWTYGTVNNVTSHTDAAGNMVRYYYDHANDTPTPYPTLLTRIVEPNDGGNPPPNQLAGQEGAYPVTRLTYDASRQLESVTDPNGVWTGFTYDQWGQLDLYTEGKYSTTVAADVYVTPIDTDRDSGGNGTASCSCASGTGGEGSHDSEGNQTGSTCTGCSCPHAGAAAAGGSGSNWFPFVLP